MTIQASIETKLSNEFAPLHLEVINESANHSVPVGSESHFKVIMVSTQFEGKAMVGRHRLVNKSLAFELENGVHALALKLMTPQQWEEAGGEHNHTSPECMHKRQP